MAKEKIIRLQEDLLARHPELQDLRTKSVVYRRAFKAGLGVAIALTIFFYLVDYDKYGISGLLFSFLKTTPLFVFLHYFTLPRLKFDALYNELKVETKPVLLAEINNSFKYSKKRLSVHEIFETGLFTSQGMKFENNNQSLHGHTIMGQYAGISVKISEIEIPQFSDSVLIVAKFGKSFGSEIFIYEKSFFHQEKLFHDEQFSLAVPQGNQVKLELPGFNKVFMTFSQYKKEAQSILSQQFAQRLLTLKNMLGNELYFSFKGEKLSILIKNKKMFGPKAFKTKEKPFSHFYQELNELLNTMEVLNTKLKLSNDEV